MAFFYFRVLYPVMVKIHGPKKHIKINISEDEINKRIDEIEHANITEELRDFMIDALRALVRLDEIVGLKGTTIARLRKIFNKKSERNIPEIKPTGGKGGKPGPGGHPKGTGKNGKDQYPQAPHIKHSHKELKKGDICPLCGKGTLNEYEPGIYIRITGTPPLNAVIHETEKFRCSACLAIFEAEFAGKNEPKYDARAMSIIGLLKYGASTPFYRLEKIQKNLFTPMPASTQWDLMEILANFLMPIWRAMSILAANGVLGHIDDTTAKVLSLIKENNLPENKGNKKFRKGMYTTGILSHLETGQKIVLYMTGRQHSGENLDDLLDLRTNAEPLTVMSDALGTNQTKRNEIYKILCLIHGRRNFLDLENKYKEESAYVLNLISKIYQNEKFTMDNNFAPLNRMEYHQNHSEPLMNELEEWCRNCFDQKLVEPNSSLGKGISYILKHWEEMTYFYKIEGMPLDNNILEEKLRLPVLNRKNFLFFKTTMGALVGNIIMSVIKTCDTNKVNAFEYMVAICKNGDEVKNNPQNWLPWNYTEQQKETPA